MKKIRVTFENGNSINTKINGTTETIINYYVGKIFNIGIDEDDLQRAVKVEFL